MEGKRDIPIQDKIALAAIAVLGRDVAETAYRMAHTVTTTNKASVGVMLSRWLNTPANKEFMASVRRGTATVHVDGAAADLTSREGIIEQLITATKQTTGRDAINGLTTLAKIQGLDKPDERTNDTHRTYVLRWLSHCRSCELMKLFLEVQNETKI